MTKKTPTDGYSRSDSQQQRRKSDIANDGKGGRVSSRDKPVPPAKPKKD